MISPSSSIKRAPFQRSFLSFCQYITGSPGCADLICFFKSVSFSYDFVQYWQKYFFFLPALFSPFPPLMFSSSSSSNSRISLIIISPFQQIIYCLLRWHTALLLLRGSTSTFRPEGTSSVRLRLLTAQLLLVAHYVVTSDTTTQCTFACSDFICLLRSFLLSNSSPQKSHL